MASHLDLEEQEQLEELKHFWKRYGNLITWILIAVLAVVAGWNGYQYWQRNQSAQAAAMFDEVQKVAQTNDPDKLLRAFGDMKERYVRTAYAAQAGLQVGQILFDAGKVEAASDVLQWVVDQSSDPAYAAIARLRLAGVLVERKQDAQALKLLDVDLGPEFAALRADRRGDIFSLQGDKEKAKTEYLAAYKALDSQEQYRHLVEVKLNALGVDPTAASAQPVAARQ